jgi:RHS repeat-associated protein
VSPAVQIQEEYYVGNQRVAYYASSALHFQHQDWEGTERLRTTYNGAVEGTFTSMPFGDAFATVSGSDGDAYHYAMLDHDYSSDTDHAQFRQYSSTPGRWMSPDPYSGSYHMRNPQSFNRYTYALNNPVSYVDPKGLYFDVGGCDDYDDDGNCYSDSDSDGAGSTTANTVIVYDQNGNEYTIDPDGSITPVDGTSISVNSGDSDSVGLMGVSGPGAPNNACSSALKAANRSAAGVARANAAWSVLQTAANANGIPTSLLAAIAVRESNFMNVQETLVGGGPGPGMGVFQLTNQRGVSSAQAFNIPFAANYAAGMLSSNMTYLSGAFSFTPSQLLQATAASYNFGVSNISGNPNTIDVGTTGGNYGSTVVGMMSCFPHS